MSIKQPSELRFLADVADHQMTVLMQQGDIYRHLRFKQPGSSDQYFELLTSPGVLLFTGDMGTFVFERSPDMFNFFRSMSPELRINPSYWSEKLQAPKYTEVEEFDEDRFAQLVISELVGWMREHRQETSKEERRELWDAVMCDVLGADGELRKQIAVSDFYLKVNEDVGAFSFLDFHEHDTTQYSYHFIWACYAIVWGIQQWDKAKAVQQEAEGSALPEVDVAAWLDEAAESVASWGAYASSHVQEKHNLAGDVTLIIRRAKDAKNQFDRLTKDRQELLAGMTNIANEFVKGSRKLVCRSTADALDYIRVVATQTVLKIKNRA